MYSGGVQYVVKALLGQCYIVVISPSFSCMWILFGLMCTADFKMVGKMANDKS